MKTMYDMAFGAAGFLMGVLLFLVLFLLWKKRENARIRALTEYLERVNTGEGGVLMPEGEDELSKLQDEIYKTVMELRQTKEAAVRARNHFAENLSNIAHQIKTPITSLSLSIQMAQEGLMPEQREQIRRQLLRLTSLQEALLLLARMDAGTLTMESEEVDVFTILILAADDLQEISLRAGVCVEIPEAEAMTVCADMAWTLEAVINVIKNGIEHTPPGGTVFCSYEQNPLYTQIRIWDTGPGFAWEDMPHIFERFYRGRGEKGEGIGIGLALAKGIIESQNGTITARNLPEGGACFEIRFYRH